MAIYVDKSVTISSVSSEDSAGSVSSLLLRAVLLLTALCDTLSDSIQYSVQYSLPKIQFKLRKFQSEN